VAVEGLELPANSAEIEDAIDPPEQMIGGDMVLQTEVVKETPLIRRLQTHHRRTPQSTAPEGENHGSRPITTPSLSTVSTQVVL
jgi:hypothetical protein